MEHLKMVYLVSNQDHNPIEVGKNINQLKTNSYKNRSSSKGAHSKGVHYHIQCSSKKFHNFSSPSNQNKAWHFESEYSVNIPHLPPGLTQNVGAVSELFIHERGWMSHQYYIPPQ